MNSAIADIVGSYFSSQPWCDKIGGLAKIVTIFDRDQNNNPTIKRFPVSCNTSLDECKQGRYSDLVPNSKLRSLFYFEDGGNTLQKRYAESFEFVARLKLVGWINLSMFKLQERQCTLSDRMVAQILKAMPDNYINTGIFTQMKIKFIGEDAKTPAIFSRYTYSEEQTQYLLFPYDYLLCLSKGE